MSWQPIETAPKDGTEILAFGMMSEGFIQTDRRPSVVTISWKEHEGWNDYEEQPCGLFKKVRKTGAAFWNLRGLMGNFEPTHWQPLPPPPSPPKDDATNAPDSGRAVIADSLKAFSPGVQRA